MKAGKNIILFAAAIICISCFFLLPQNQAWMTQRVLVYWHAFQNQKGKLDIEQRKIMRYETSYTFSKSIAGFFEKKHDKKEALLLIPSTDYFKAYKINYPVPEPAVFYYFTGLKTVWPDSKNAVNANWFVTIRTGTMYVDSVTSKTVLQDTITSFKKFGVSL